MKPDTQSKPLTHDEIAKLAYFFFEERGRKHGHDVEDWLAAEAHICTNDQHVPPAAKNIPKGRKESRNEFLAVGSPQ